MEASKGCMIYIICVLIEYYSSRQYVQCFVDVFVFTLEVVSWSTCCMREEIVAISLTSTHQKNQWTRKVAEFVIFPRPLLPVRIEKVKQYLFIYFFLQ